LKAANQSEDKSIVPQPDLDKTQGDGLKNENESEEQKNQKLSIKLLKMGLIPAWMLTRTKKCQHKYSCYENVIISFYKIFVNAVALKTAINSLFYLGNFKKYLRSLKDVKEIKDTCRFALFFALMNSVYKLVLCFLRRFDVSDSIAAPIAGFLSGIVSMFEKKNRRELISIVVLSRVVDTTINVGEDRGFYRRWPKTESFVLFTISNVLM
jgi:hypothetical protein